MGTRIRPPCSDSTRPCTWTRVSWPADRSPCDRERAALADRRDRTLSLLLNNRLGRPGALPGERLRLRSRTTSIAGGYPAQGVSALIGVVTSCRLTLFSSRTRGGDRERHR